MNYGMTPEEWWKNFALGIELDVSGTFIYNGIQALDELQSLRHSGDSFEILYSFSVGFERLLKICIVLLEHKQHSDIAALEKSLLSHNTMELANRIDELAPLELSKLQKEFLALLSNFYKTHRYSRYSLSSVPDIEKEKRIFLSFIDKHLHTSLSNADSLDYIPNTDQIRKFVGRIIKKITRSIFAVISDKASCLNIYLAELRVDSKAMRIFYGDRLDFIDERIKKKEILLYLMKSASNGTHSILIQTLQPLKLDEASIPYYVQAVLRDSALSAVGDEIDELYLDLEDVRKRLELIDQIDYEHLVCDEGLKEC